MPHRVLVVDDSPLILSMLRASLESAGFVVDTAVTLDELEAHRDKAPDVVVLDVQMPEAWGDDVAATLRGAYGLSAPILLMSSIEPEELARRAEEVSVAWVSKRDGLDRVVERVQRIVAEAK